MECQQSDSKKLFKVFDATSRRQRSRKVRDGFDDSNSLATDDSNIGHANSVGLTTSERASMQDVSALQSDVAPDARTSKRDRESSPSPARESVRSSHSPRRHRRHQRDLISLALKPGHVSTPRSVSQSKERHGITNILNQDQDSYVYAFLEEAIKRDLRRQRREGRSRERERSACRPHHHHRRRRDETETAPKEKTNKEAPVVDQTALLQTFAQICAQMTNKNNEEDHKEVKRSLSHKSLQCEVLKGDSYEVDQRPTRLLHQDHSWDNIPSSRVRSYEHLQDRGGHRSPVCVPPIALEDRRERVYVYDKVGSKYASKIDLNTSRAHANNIHCTMPFAQMGDERCRDYRREAMPCRSRLSQNYGRDETPTRNRLEQGYRQDETAMMSTRSRMDQCYRRRTPDRRDFREYDERRDRTPKRNDETNRRDRTPKRNDERDRRHLEQKTSRSFDVHRDPRTDEYEDKRCRRSTRSETNKKRFEDLDRRYDDRKEKYYEDRALERESRARHFGNLPSKDHRSRRNLEQLERNSVASREEYYREKDRNSERERDSGLSIADGENSSISGKSNYLRVVKQEIAEQREAMDKMMKLWKELMRCFKSMSQTQGQSDKVQESAANVQESAAAQLRLWRECMRRYETVARDVGDTDARLMEEINKQRSEMAEMSTMWQECLQRYREMSNDFNSLKERIVSSNSPTRPAAVPPLMHAEGEAVAPPPNYRLPPTYPPPMPAMGGGYGPTGGSPIRSRMSAPPAWWWSMEQQQQQQKPQRRRSSPESRGSRGSHGSRERRRRHKERERDDTRYKDKTSKAGGARSVQKHRKR